MIGKIVKRRAGRVAPFDWAFVHLFVILMQVVVKTKLPSPLEPLIAAYDLADAWEGIDVGQKMHKEVGLSLESPTMTRGVTTRILCKHPSKTCITKRRGQRFEDWKNRVEDWKRSLNSGELFYQVVS